ncbi:GNAT family N-acetyltransferase [Planctomycetota bacterium]
MVSKSLTIRGATDKDIAALATMGAQTFSLAYSSIIGPKDLESYVQEAFSPELIASERQTGQTTFILAEVEHIPCAYAGIRRSQLPEGITLLHPVELQRLYVLPEWFGQGIGTAMLSHIVSWIKQHCYRSCWLRVWEKNLRAIALYKRWDFQTIGSEPYYVGDVSETVLVMTREF